MKISLRHLIATGASIANGAILGGIQGDLEREQRDARDFGQMAQLIGMQERGEDRALGRRMQGAAYDQNLLNSEFVDEESGQAILDRQVALGDELRAPRPDPYAALYQTPHYRRMLRHNPQLAGAVPSPTLPGAPPPGPAPGAIPPGGPTPGAAPAPGAMPAPGAAPTTAPATKPRFVPKRERDVEAIALQSLLSIEKSAEDAEGATEAAGIRVALRRKEITPDQALERARAIETRSRADTLVSTDFTRQRGDWDDYLAKGQITEANVGPVGELIGRMRALGTPNTKEKRAQAAALLAELGTLSSKPGVLQPDADSRQRQSATEFTQFGAAKGEIEKTLTALRQGKGMTPEWVLSQINTLGTYLKDPRVAKFGYKLPVDFDLNAREVEKDLPVEDAPGSFVRQKVLEEENEIQARNLVTAAKYTEDPAERTKLLKGAYDKLLGFVQSSQFKALQDKNQRAGVIQSLNDVADELDLPKLPANLSPTLTPAEKSLVDYRQSQRDLNNKKYADSKRNVDSLIGHRNWLQQIGDKKWQHYKANFDKLHPGGKGKEESQALVKRLDELKADYDRFMDKVDEATGPTGIYGDLVTRSSPEMKKQRAEIVGPWEQEASRIRSEMNAIIKKLPGGEKVFGPEGDRTMKGLGGDQTTTTYRMSFQYGGKSYTLPNASPSRAVPTPGGAPSDYSGHFGKFNARVLQSAMAIAGNPEKEKAFKAKFADPNDGDLYLWEARFKLSGETGAR